VLPQPARLQKSRVGFFVQEFVTATAFNAKTICGHSVDQQMAQHSVRELLLMVLAVLHGLGILLLLGARLFHAAASPFQRASAALLSP
jgi:hypothetical protein